MKLPDKPSELITLALKDEDKAHRSSKYEINMNKWHEPNGVCKVCLAGAVMAYSLDAGISIHMEPDDYNLDIDDKLWALDEFRCGKISDGLYMMNLSWSGDNRIPITQYENNRIQWRKDMRGIVKLLK